MPRPGDARVRSVTASLHALGHGAEAGGYYTGDRHPDAELGGRDRYYAGDNTGMWWSTGGSIVGNGRPIDLGTFQDLCAGRDPKFGDPLVRAAGAQHRAGWDVTFSCPKTMSLLWAAGDEAQRRRIEAIHDRAVDDALRFLVDEGLLYCRRGAGGIAREKPVDLIVGRFCHHTSRAGDPNLHTHAVIMNVAGCADGRHRTLEPKKLFEWQIVIGAAYRAALAERLVALGLTMRPAGRDQVEIAGIGEDVIEQFSKRSREIEEAVGRDASGAAKEVAALRTRAAKADLAEERDLEALWKEDLDRMGVVPWRDALSAGRAVEHEAGIVEPSAELDPPEITGTSPVAVAASGLFRHVSVVDRKDLLRTALVEAASIGTSIGEVRAEIDALEKTGHLVRLDAEHWTTPAIAAAEARLVEAVDRPDERRWFRPAAVETALAAAQHLSAEQRDAVIECTGRAGAAVLEAGAGTGKTTMAKALVEAARGSGLRVLGLAPSWVAADELRRSAAIDAQSIAKWRWGRTKGNAPALDRRTLVIVDEAGMAGVKDLAFVAQEAAAAGAKIVFVGDRRQLESVSGGSALRLIHEVVGRAATLEEVRRQEVDWQREASRCMVAGDTAEGFRAYVDHGRLDLVVEEEAARARVIEKWQELRARYGSDVLLLTRRNTDAASLNAAARNVLRQEGRISVEEHRLPSIDRRGRRTEIDIAVSDRVRFGENLPDHGLRNGTRAEVVDVRRTADGQVFVSFRTEDGRTVEGPWATFSGQNIGRGPTVPRISHAYAGTIHSAQGRTAEAAVLYIARPTDAREVYVGLTRHRKDAVIVAAIKRFEISGLVVSLPGSAPAIASPEVAQLLSEAGRYHDKENAADYRVVLEKVDAPARLERYHDFHQSIDI